MKETEIVVHSINPIAIQMQIFPTTSRADPDVKKRDLPTILRIAMSRQSAVGDEWVIIA